MAGYSGAPLGAEARDQARARRSRVLGAPEGFTIDDLAHERRRAHDGPRVRSTSSCRSTGSARDLAKRLPVLMRALHVDGGLWIAWPKRASGVPSDITEDVVRDVALPTGLVDVKVCAIDDTWSGLRLCLRKELRPGRTRAAG